MALNWHAEINSSLLPLKWMRRYVRDIGTLIYPENTFYLFAPLSSLAKSDVDIFGHRIF